MSNEPQIDLLVLSGQPKPKPKPVKAKDKDIMDIVEAISDKMQVTEAKDEGAKKVKAKTKTKTAKDLDALKETNDVGQAATIAGKSKKRGKANELPEDNTDVAKAINALEHISMDVDQPKDGQVISTVVNKDQKIQKKSTGKKPAIIASTTSPVQQDVEVVEQEITAATIGYGVMMIMDNNDGGCGPTMVAQRVNPCSISDAFLKDLAESINAKSLRNWDTANAIVLGVHLTYIDTDSLESLHLGSYTNRLQKAKADLVQTSDPKEKEELKKVRDDAFKEVDKNGIWIVKILNYDMINKSKNRAFIEHQLSRLAAQADDEDTQFSQVLTILNTILMDEQIMVPQLKAGGTSGEGFSIRLLTSWCPAIGGMLMYISDYFYDVLQLLATSNNLKYFPSYQAVKQKAESNQEDMQCNCWETASMCLVPKEQKTKLPSRSGATSWQNTITASLLMPLSWRKGFNATLKTLFSD
ncbi:hypothetical protein DFH29DRAFT_1032697 [Suillus ampliporus]|nr:hypothetical protein DFH29DRAFT_1032697 [Suillus ampliporus]